MAKKYRSDVMATIHKTMEILHEVGTVDKQTMRDFDDTCHLPEHYETDQTDPA
ncbi:hypothetical protein ACFQH5_20030 [Halomonas salifodinae]|uniref:Transcriptional regulator n=1 Tax=Halomonas salifodinae TaxID=438745 RepID=A0ABW2F1B5_9GAMM